MDIKEIAIEIAIEKKPKQFLLKLIEKGVKISQNKPLSNITDDDCRIILREIIKELKLRENIQ